MIGRFTVVIAACVMGLRPTPGDAAESFESLPPGPITALDSTVGRWTAAEGHAEVHTGRARAGRPHDGNQGLRLLGGHDRIVDLVLADAARRD